MKKVFPAFSLFLFALSAPYAQPFEVQQIRLDNGLTVFLNEDPTADKVYGAVIVKAGGKHDPPDATGIAHYLEHLLFKGTTDLGTVDFEKEKPHLDSIRLLYDQLAKATTDEQKRAVQLEINRHAVAAAPYGLPTEFDRLLKSIGSTRVNAFTNYEMTFYYNYFPPNQIARWLDIYAHRFQNPVFRSFQSELEVVYEEKNRAMDDLFRRVFETFQSHVFPKQPYGMQSVLGTVEHLKTPSLTKMYEYFNNYYVAGNMALILSGNFDSAQVVPLIREKFGKLRSGEAPALPDYPVTQFNGKEKVNVRITPIKAGFLGYKTIPLVHPDREAVDVCNSLIFNDSETGLLNRLQLDDKLLFCGSSPLIYKDDGATMVFFVPKILVQSLKKAEKMVMAQIDKIKKGEFSDDMLEAVKNQTYKDFQESMENIGDRAEAIGWAFALDVGWDEFLGYPDRIRNVTKEDVMRAAQKYYGEDFVAMYSRTGFPKKPKLTKPPYKPVVTDQSRKSAYAERFEKLETLPLKPRFIDFQKDVRQIELAGGNRLFVTPNPVNDIFEINIKYHIGTETDRDLDLAARLMNYSGTQSRNLNEVKEKFAALGASYDFEAAQNYFIVNLTGVEDNLEASLQLLDELLTKARPDKKSLDLIVNDIGTERRLEKNSPSQFGGVLFNYGVHEKDSPFLRQHSLREINKMDPPQLKASFDKAVTHAASIHYTGKRSAGEIKESLEKNLTLPSGAVQTPKIYREGVARSENTVFLLHDKKAVQSQVYFYIQGEPYDGQDLAAVTAFNKYFGDGFSGLVLQEIREYRSLAYATLGRYYTPELTKGKKGRLLGFIGCQSDKTSEAVGVMMDLLTDMPQRRERMPLIRESLQLETATGFPTFRELSQRIESYQTFGLDKDPNQILYPAAGNLEFDDIMRFYESTIKNKPVTITVYGDKRKIDLDKLKQYGNLVELKRKEVWRR
jgi:zinc protease